MNMEKRVTVTVALFFCLKKHNGFAIDMLTFYLKKGKFISSIASNL
ncbi:hypothetical protein B4110_2957 [Parageobacillus toebii]|uniref:Uncharacterized protein n=1 Tax=Parageobacillus toebii TaxID=153151 RepID=A0A150N100_9BACL|nr:hypothetical protein B4110_2957 [Parageobacillus toebii]